MKDKIIKIAQELEQGIITETEAQTLLLGLFCVSNMYCDKCGSEYYHTYKCVNTNCDNCIIYK